VSSESVPASLAHGVLRFGERRHRNRLTIPSCRECGSPQTAVATRTAFVLYIRCQVCSGVWSVRKPVYEPVEA